MAVLSPVTQYFTGTHDKAVRDGQISTSQAVFCTAVAIFTAAQQGPGFQKIPKAPRYSHASHQAAVANQQIASSVRVFRAATLPPGAGLGLGRTFAITQEEHPPWRQSSVKVNSALLASQGVQQPLLMPWLQTWPQYPLDQSWSVLFHKPPPTAAAPAQPPIGFIQSAGSPQYPPDQLWATSFFPPAQIPSAFLPVTSVIVAAEEIGDGQQGQLQLRWSPSGGASGYDVYINGMHAAFVSGQSYLATGLVRGTQYTFAVVAVFQGADDSILSNEIPERHGLNEISYVYKYPWGNTFQTGYRIKYKLGDKV